MVKSKFFSTLALTTVLATGAFITSGPANAVPACPALRLVSQNDGNNDGQMHRRHHVPDGADMQQSGDNQSMDWRRRHHHDYSDNNPQFGIYVNNGYNDGYGYNEDYGVGYGYGNRWHHRRHCRVIKIWRHHHPVWVKKCFWPHYQ